jgi:hypothetical protein
MVLALATAGFGKVLGRHQVVGHRDDWKQYQDDH